MGQDSNYLKAIKEFKGYEFVVPSYQRGYRWGKQEVEALLGDIYDFMDKYKDRDSRGYFYCLQPIVVHELSSKRFSVIDGQQRLTTIFLILKYLDGGGENFFSLDYETREESGEFLRKISQNVELEDTGNIDFEHFRNAYGVICKFFDDREECDERKSEFGRILLESCKVLWYAVGGDEGDGDKVETKVFIRLNTGKIPLTLAENVKALFLLDDGNGHKGLEERAKIWHEAEIGLRKNDDFAYLVLSKIEPKDMMELKEEKRMILKDDVMRIEAYLRFICPEKDLFKFFYNAYREEDIDYEWKRLKKCIDGLESLVVLPAKANVDICNYIGFLVQNEMEPNKIYKIWEKNKESIGSIREQLMGEIKKVVSDDINKLDELEYGGGETVSEKIKRLLLLFNLELCGKNKCFEFNFYQLEKWELEHIYPQNSAGIGEALKECLERDDSPSVEPLLAELREYVPGDSLNDDGDKSRLERFQDNEWRDWSKRIDKFLKNCNRLNGVGNLTLLDKRANSGVGNLVFYKKRKKILDLADKGKFIPIATLRVFSKEFSEGELVSSPFVFMPKDQADYLNAIKKALQKFTK